jgi:hypothetical protein
VGETSIDTIRGGQERYPHLILRALRPGEKPRQGARVITISSGGGGEPEGFANSGGLVFVDESAKEIAAAETSGRVRRCRAQSVGREELERALRRVLVVVAAVDAEHVLEMPAAQDEDAVRAVGAESAHPALGVGVRVRGLDGRAYHPDALDAKDLIEGVAEFRVAIMDEEPERLLVAELHDEVARLLGDPASVRVSAGGDVLDPPGRERDEEEDVDPLQEGCLDGEKVAGEHAGRLRSQERAPRAAGPLRRWLHPFFKQDLPH